MKLSNNSIGMLIFIALATAVFVLMVLRPAVDGNAMNLGVPMSSEMAAAITTDPTATDSGSTEPEPSAQKESPISIDLNAEADESDATDSDTTTDSSASTAQKESPISTDLNGEAEESDPATDESSPKQTN